jgi:hypothetical protein
VTDTFATPRLPRGPRGCLVGDVVIAEGTRWLVVGLDRERQEAICQLETGARILRRFRARRILAVERTSRSAV